MRRKNDTRYVTSIQYTFNANHRETMQALARASFNNCEFRIVVALMNQTDGYTREEDEISISFWQAITLMGRQSVHSALSNLLSLNVIAQNEQTFKLNPPNSWDSKIFQPQRLPRRSISRAKGLLTKEKEKNNYSWLKKALETADKTSLTSDDSESKEIDTEAVNKITPPKETAEETSLTSDDSEGRHGVKEAKEKGEVERPMAAETSLTSDDKSQETSLTSDAERHQPVTIRSSTKEEHTKESRPAKDSDTPEAAASGLLEKVSAARTPAQTTARAPYFKEALKELSDARNKPAVLFDIIRKKFPDYDWDARASPRSWIGRCGQLLKTFGIRKVLEAFWLTETQAREGDPVSYAQAILIARGKIPGRGEATQRDFRKW